MDFPIENISLHRQGNWLHVQAYKWNNKFLSQHEWNFGTLYFFLSRIGLKFLMILKRVHFDILKFSTQ
jgi:hypothetical protein